MKNLTRERFFWPRLNNDLEKIHTACRECKKESSSKPHKADLLLIVPAEEISVDFMQYGSQDIMVIKDRSSGYIAAKLTKDKTTNLAVIALRKWFYSLWLLPCHPLRWRTCLQRQLHQGDRQDADKTCPLQQLQSTIQWRIRENRQEPVRSA